MQLTVPIREHRRIRLRGARPGSRQSGPSTPEPTAVERPAQHMRERAAGGPEDVARYECACGFVFKAPVSASVGCPHCGSAQDW
jgi:hypothetical protein